MANLKAAVQDFLAQQNIAVAGVSRNPKEAANLIYRKLRDAGYQVLPVNPNAVTVEGDRCYPNLASLPQRVDAVVIATHPRVAGQLVGECAALGISRVWLHRSFGQGSVSAEAVHLGREQNIAVIPGGCPMMFQEPVDLGHRCMRWLLGLTRGLPKPEGNI